jgi:MFS family permease
VIAGRRQDKAILISGLISDRIGLALLYIVFGPLSREIGLSESQFGILIASANVALGFASPYWGERSQTLGRRPVFVIGLSGYAAGFLLLAVTLEAGLSGWLTAWPLFIALLAVRLSYGLFAAATQPAATAYLADVTDATNRTRGMALIGVAAGIGTVLGPTLGGSLSAIGPVVPLYVAGILAGVVAGLAYHGLREPARHTAATTADKMRFTDRRIFPYLMGWFVAILVLTAIQTITAFYLADRFALGEREAVTRATSVAFLIMGIAMIVTQAGVLQVLRIRPVWLLRLGFMLFGVALLMLLSASDLIVLYVAFGLLGLGFSLVSPGLNAAASISVSDGEQGAVAGLLSAAPVFGMVVGPVAGTALYSLNPVWPIALGAAICVATGLYFLVSNGSRG